MAEGTGGGGFGPGRGRFGERVVSKRAASNARAELRRRGLLTRGGGRASRATTGGVQRALRQQGFLNSRGQARRTSIVNRNTTSRNVKLARAIKGSTRRNTANILRRARRQGAASR